MRPNLKLAILIAAIFGLSHPCLAQQTVTAKPYMAVLKSDPATIAAGKASTVDIFVMDATSIAPSQRLTITASVSMSAMAGMSIDPPKVTPGDKIGHYSALITFPQPGEYKLDVSIKSPSGKSASLSFRISVGSGGKGAMKGMEGMHDMTGMRMQADFGKWSANREWSGTSWQPDSSPMFMKMLPSFGGFEFGTMGTFQAGYIDAGGKRGDKGFFTNSMIMLMGRKDMGGGTLGVHFMSSLDPILNGQKGVPNLFQNGFTVHDVDISDRKDPHNIFAELAASYSHPLAKNWSGFIYGGPVGEPALGNVMYFHRPSGLDIPEAPISHDWFDGTHISFGVATAGLAYQDKWKIEGSVFNGHDPVNLYGIGPVALNSASGRLSYNPSRDWSLSASYGYINSDVNEHRFTVGAAYSHDFSSGDNLSATGYFGQNIVQDSPKSNAWLAEATYYHAKEAFFTRFERVDKGELLNVPDGIYTVNKLLFGDVHNFYSKDQLEYGLGVYAGVYSFPSSLNPYYGKSPITLGVFLRIRPSKM